MSFTHLKASTFCLLNISAKRKNENHKKLVERLNNNALKQCFLSEAHSSSLSSKGLAKTFQRENLNSREVKLFNSLFHSVFLVFSTRFSIASTFAVCYLWKTYLTKRRDK